MCSPTPVSSEKAESAAYLIGSLHYSASGPHAAERLSALRLAPNE